MAKTHIAIFPLSWGMGHFLPLAAFAERLCNFGGFSITFIISKWKWGSQQPILVQRLASSGLDIRFREIPEITVDENEQHLIFFQKAKPHIQELLQSLHSSSPISSFVTDFFCTDLLDFSASLNIPSYLFSPSSASFVCFMLHLPKLVSEIEVSFKDLQSDVEIPGLPLISARDLPNPVQDRSVPAFNWFVHQASRFKEASGILIDTFAELEEEAIKALSAEGNPCIYTIGPLMFSDSEALDESRCLEWLDQQPLSSVLFVAFGSRAVLSKEQITDLAIGLESSGHRFLWVLRGHKSGDSSSPETDISQLLPEGFEIRTRDRGLVLLNWAPQIPVLSHPSTGGFLSHCGWNSTLESVSHGVPMIAWPLFAEQRMNKVILVKQIQVAIDLRMESNGFVRREEVERAVRELMEGEEGSKAREKMKELKDKAKIALMEGGSTMKATANVATDLSQKLSLTP
ncbi:UDP-glycosyltransferase 72B1 [Cryptomeria japonica]|uniref:UDP-glycosyltransferase 72B1 n=1 Tax=Cryptomeria japonica TaxID=3369 RepID=UPI0027DA2AA3|nr:UDP-glycosyltransferase 72B1 [Cryptomeria japonica]